MVSRLFPNEKAINNHSCSRPVEVPLQPAQLGNAEGLATLLRVVANTHFFAGSPALFSSLSDSTLEPLAQKLRVLCVSTKGDKPAFEMLLVEACNALKQARDYTTVASLTLESDHPYPVADWRKRISMEQVLRSCATFLCISPSG